MSVTFVAEVSSNHNQDIERCLAFIDKASEIGCDAVKFQLFKIEELFAPEILAKSEEHRQRKTWELPVEFVPTLANRCRETGIQFACTPFYLKAVDKLLPYVDFYKIASYELLWGDLLSACARTGKPVVLSTGMATMDEVKAAVNILIESGCENLTLLHCISGYPIPINECNLAAIETLRSSLYLKLHTPSSMPQAPCFSVGWSDHSVNPSVIYRSVHRWGAEMIEFHLDLDGTGEEYKTGHCWLPDQIKAVIETVRAGFRSNGTGKKTLAPSELSDRDWRADPRDGLRPLKHFRINFDRIDKIF